LTEEKIVGDKAKIEELKFLFGLFSKTVKIVVLYPPDNPLPKEFKKNFSEKFAAFLASQGTITLTIKPGEFWCENEKVFVETSREESIASRMHTDGIREVTFSAETTADEILSFLEAFREVAQIKGEKPVDSAKTEEAPDDLVTKLWEKELVHIRFQVVESPVTQSLDLTPYEVVPAEIEQTVYREIILEENGEGNGTLTDEQKQDPRQTFNPQVRTLIENLGNPQELEKEEVQGIKERLALEANFDPFSQELFILKEILLQENQKAEFDETVSIFRKLFDERLEKADFSGCHKLLTAAREVGDLVGEESPRKREKLLELQQRAGDRNRIATVVKAANTIPDASAEHFETYLSGLGRTAFTHMVGMLGDLESFAFRRAVCRVLEARGIEVLDLVGNAVYDKRWFVVRNVTAVLGKIGGERAIDYLKKPLIHPDPRVKKEALTALAHVATPKAYLLMAEALRDDDEKVRIMVLKYLAQCRKKELLTPLAEGMEEKHFSKKSDEEKRAWFLAAAKTGQEEAVLPLVKKIKQFSFFERRELRNEKLLAVEALGFCGNAAASFLSSLAGKKDREMAHKAQEALGRIGFAAPLDESQRAQEG